MSNRIRHIIIYSAECALHSVPLITCLAVWYGIIRFVLMGKLYLGNFCVPLIIIMLICTHFSLMRFLRVMNRFKNTAEYSFIKKIVSKKEILSRNNSLIDDQISSEPLIEYYKINYDKNLVIDPVWREAALIYFFNNHFDRNLIEDDKMYKERVLRDCVLNQDKYIEIVTEEIRIIYLSDSCKNN